MIKGKTKTGFNFEINEQRFNNMEFIDLLVSTEKSNLTDTQTLIAVSELLDLMLEPDEKKKLYDHCRTDKGNVPIDKVYSEVMDIISYNGEENEEVKNS